VDFALYHKTLATLIYKGSKLNPKAPLCGSTPVAWCLNFKKGASKLTLLGIGTKGFSRWNKFLEIYSRCDIFPKKLTIDKRYKTKLNYDNNPIL